MRWIYIGIISCLLLFASCAYTQDRDKEISVQLNKEFWLLKNQTAMFPDNNLNITVTKLVYNPCRGNNCLWSGMGVWLTVEKDSQLEETNLALPEKEHVSVFGYRITLEDMNKYRARFKVQALEYVSE